MNLKEKVVKVKESKWFPDRKAIAGGLTGLATFFVSAALGVDPETSAMLVGAAITIAHYFVPESISDKIKRADTVIKDKSGVVTDILWKNEKVSEKVD